MVSHDPDLSPLKVVFEFLASHDQGVGKFFKVWIARLGDLEDLADIVHWLL